jgi:hypothetical protein
MGTDTIHERLSVHGFVPYVQNEGPLAGVPHWRDSEGRDWYDLQKQFRDDTMKYIYDEDNNLNCFGPDIRFMIPMDGTTITEVPFADFPNVVDLNPIWTADASGVRCRIDNVPERMANVSQYFDRLADSSPMVAMELSKWRATPGFPYCVFPTFAPHIVSKAVALGLSRADYETVTLTKKKGK